MGRRLEIRCSMNKLTGTTILVVMLGGAAYAASSALDYEKRIFRAGEQAERMKTDSAYAEEGAATIKTLAPKREEISTESQTVEVDNTWLHEALDNYFSEPDSKEKAKKLDEIRARLKALDDELRKALNPKSSNAAVEGRMAEILARAEFQPKKENFIAALIRKAKTAAFELIKKLYAIVFNAIFGQGAYGNPIYRFVIVGVLVFVGVVVVRMALILGRGPRRRKKKRELLGEEIDAEVTSSDLASAALAAARAGDFRTGMRKLYIALLYELAERNLVEIERDTTNHEYLAQAARFKPLAGPMSYLTDRFDYFWYGMFPSSEEDFSSYFVRYKEALESARSLQPQPN